MKTPRIASLYLGSAVDRAILAVVAQKHCDTATNSSSLTRPTAEQRRFPIDSTAAYKSCEARTIELRRDTAIDSNSLTRPTAEQRRFPIDSTVAYKSCEARTIEIRRASLLLGQPEHGVPMFYGPRLGSSKHMISTEHWVSSRGCM